MRRAIVILLYSALIVALALAIGLLHGHLSFQVGNVSVETSTPIALVALAVLFVVLYVVLRLLAGLVRLPRYWRGRRHRRQRVRGDGAVTRALVALAAGDAPAARDEAARARRLLGDTAQTLLLTAEAARLAERQPEAEAAFRLLAARRDLRSLACAGSSAWPSLGRISPPPRHWRRRPRRHAPAGPGFVPSVRGWRCEQAIGRAHSPWLIPMHQRRHWPPPRRTRRRIRASR